VAFLAGGVPLLATVRKIVKRSPYTMLVYWFFLLAYFWSLAGDGLWALFAADDPANLAGYQQRGLGRVLVDNICIFNGAYRPLGGLFYLITYQLAHLDPFPYRIVILILLTVNLVLAYRFALLVTGCRATAQLAVFLSCYHVNLIALYYYTSMIYDVLCFTFYFGALSYYFQCSRSPGFNVLRTLWFSLLYIAALNAKEMALTIPAIILAWELFPVVERGRAAGLSLRSNWKPIAASLLITAAYLPGKIWGREALAASPAYRLVPDLKTFLTANASYIENIFYRPLDSVQWQHTLWVWSALLAVILIWRRWRVLFCWWIAIVSGAPTAMIGRGGGPGLYIPLMAWSVLVAALLVGATRLFSAKYWKLATQAAIMVLVVSIAWYTHHMKWTQMPAVYSGQQTTWFTIESLRKLNPHVPKGAKVLFIDDPFEGWDTLFIARLWFRDPSLDVTLSRKLDRPLTADHLDSYDRVFAFKGGSLEIVPRRRDTSNLCIIHP